MLDVLASSRSDGERLVLHFLLAHSHHIVVVLHRALADPLSQRPTRQPLPSTKQVRWEDIHSQFVFVAIRQLLSNLLAVLPMAWVRHRQQSNLIRREAKREPSVAMLDIHSQKPL